ncbi:MAG: ABC transporter ATP-binding protein, partial [Roseicyclus sp.]|nr:ABC transporter ATP-binding protein [Roseicyclus sp.]
AVVYAGGWTDMLAQRGARAAEDVAKAKAKSVKNAAQSVDNALKPALSFTEKHRLEELPSVIRRLESEIAKLLDLLSDPAIYTTQAVKAQKAADALAERQSRLEAAELEWLTLEEKAG